MRITRQKSNGSRRRFLGWGKVEKMSDFSDEFAFSPRRSGKGQFAEGDWHGDDITIVAATDGDAESSIETLERLYRSWKAWLSDLQDALVEEYGDPGELWIERITAFEDDYFEIELSAPDIFEEETALAVGTLKDGFTEVGVGG